VTARAGSARRAAAAPLVVSGVSVAPGERRSLRIPVTRRYTHAEVFLPAHVIHGREPGPRLFVCAAMHGDEIVGVEIIRRLLRRTGLGRLRGSLIAVPVVNVYGFAAHQRYSPDRRDLNRTFPGSAKGSLTSRLADVFMNEVVANATHGIDLHTGSLHRTNLPHVRGCLDQPETARLARAFGTPVIMNANVRDGSLRQAVLERKMPMLVFEGGEALRFDEFAIRSGVRGVLAVMRTLGMLPGTPPAPPKKPFVAWSSSWIRAPGSGILSAPARLGKAVHEGDLLAVVSDPLGEEGIEVRSTLDGIIVGRTMLPLVNEGDALFHIARFDEPASVAEELEAYQADLEPPLAPGDETST